MIRNYLNITFRNIIKSPIYFIINLLGLSIGMGACFLIIQYVYFESTFDAFHKDSENIYRVIQYSGDGGGADTPVAVASLIPEEFEAVENITHIRKIRGVLESNNGKSISNKEQDMIFAGADFLNIFNFPLLSGDINALSEPNKVFLTKEMADKYFKDLDPLGREVTLFESNFGEIKLEVAGVLENPPLNTNITFNALASMITIEKNNNGQFWATFDNWGWLGFYTFVKLRPGKTITQEQTKAFLDKYIGKEARVQGQVRVELQPLKDIRTNSSLANEYGITKDKNTITFLLVVALFILTMACINYINLTTAKGFERAKEIGVRKNLGATRGNIIGQFSLEALLVNLSALFVAITVVQMIQPWLAYSIGGAFKVTIWETPGVLLLGMIPFILGLTWSVLQPAWLISSFSMVAILKGKVINHGKGLIYRKWSVIFQFSISLTLMVSSFIIYNQVRFLQNKDLGMNIDQLLVVEKPLQAVENYAEKSKLFQTTLNTQSAVAGVSVSGSVPAKGYNYSTSNIYKKGGQPGGLGDNGLWITYIDDTYVDVYDIEMAAGVSGHQGGDQQIKVVINESALRSLNFISAEEAVGTTLVIGGDKPENEFEVIGVMKDYNHNTVKTQYQPILFFVQRNANFFTIKYNSGDDPLKATQRLLKQVKEDYQNIFPDNAFNYFFMDEEFEENYRAESNFGQVMLLFTSLAILLACLGLFGLSLFNLSRRTKEMGVRKTLGATSTSLLVHTSKDFVKLITIATLPALPLAFYLADKWLADYPFKVDITWYSFVIPTVGLMIISLMTAAYHMLKLSNTNPVESLRYE